MVNPSKNHNKDVITKLESIENKLLYLIEARDYIMDSDQNSRKDITELEKKIDLERRNEKVERLKKAEAEELLEKQIKNEERSKNLIQTTIIPSGKKLMVRSDKPEHKMKRKNEVSLTEEQMDYIKYVLN